MKIDDIILKVKEILKGIDEEQCTSEDGWWETSDGADFGRQKLNELILYFIEIEEEL